MRSYATSTCPPARRTSPWRAGIAMRCTGYSTASSSVPCANACLPHSAPMGPKPRRVSISMVKTSHQARCVHGSTPMHPAPARWASTSPEFGVRARDASTGSGWRLRPALPHTSTPKACRRTTTPHSRRGSPTRRSRRCCMTPRARCTRSRHRVGPLPGSPVIRRWPLICCDPISVPTTWPTSHCAICSVNSAPTTLALRAIVVGAEFTLQIAQCEVGQVVGTLIGSQQISGQRRITGDPGKGPTLCLDRVHRALGVMQHLRLRRVGEPRRECGVVVLRHAFGVDVCGNAGRSRQPDPVDASRARTPNSGDVDAQRAGAGCMGVEPCTQRAWCDVFTIEIETLLGFGPIGAECGKQAFAQGTELEAVEYPVHRIAIPALQGEVRRAGGQVEVAYERIEVPVADHIIEMFAQ